jgi:hypothetical protein
MARSTPIPVRWSARTLWFIDALVEQGYGQNPTDVVRRFVLEGIRRAQDAGDIPRSPKRKADDIPPPSAPEDDDL